MSVGNRNRATLKEVQEAIQEVLTPDFFKSLVKYSIHRLYYKFDIKYDLNKGIRGITIEDIIQDTLEALLKEGRRNWYKDKFPDIKSQIISSLDSVIYNTVKKHFEKLSVTYELFDNEEIETNDNKEYENLLEICINELTKLNATDEEILLFEPYIIQKMKRQDLSDFYGISTNELTNLKKRLDRKLPLLKSKLIELGYE